MNLLSQMKNIVRPQSLRRKLLRIVQALSTNVLELHSTIAHLQAQASERSAAIAHLQAEASERSAAIAHLQAENVQFKLGHHFAPGHFYSTIPNLEEVRRYHDVIFNRLPRQLPGIDLNEAGQVQLYEEFLQYLDDADFPRDKRPGLRYYSENGWYPFGDAIFLYAMMRHHKPTRIIEVGSGFSSCVILDTNERFFQNRIRCTFIEPEPERFLRAIHPEDKERVDLVAGDVRDLTPEYFQCLSAGDILLIDSSHVSKVHSDVNWLMFEVLPALRSGDRKSVV